MLIKFLQPTINNFSDGRKLTIGEDTPNVIAGNVETDVPHDIAMGLINAGIAIEITEESTPKAIANGEKTPKATA